MVNQFVSWDMARIGRNASNHDDPWGDVTFGGKRAAVKVASLTRLCSRVDYTPNFKIKEHLVKNKEAGIVGLWIPNKVDSKGIPFD